MPKKLGPQIDVTGPARRDITQIVRRTINSFGEAAALRYEDLIVQAISDIAADPSRPGAHERPEIMISGARTYHLSYSRNKVMGPRVKEPRHFLLYRQREDKVIEVARILHDSQDLERHLPAGYRHEETER